jgi:aspartate kinase
MLEMASLGAKVLQTRSVKFAKRYRVPLHVRSSFSEAEGTWVVPEEDVMEGLVVSGSPTPQGAKIRIKGVKDAPGVAASIFLPLSEAGIVVDMIVQNVSQDGNTDVTFTVPRDDFARASEIARQAAVAVSARDVEGDKAIAKVSVVGLGMKDHAGVAARIPGARARGINIQLISTSEIKISVVIEKYVELAVRAARRSSIREEAA